MKPPFYLFNKSYILRKPEMELDHFILYHTTLLYAKFNNKVIEDAETRFHFLKNQVSLGKEMWIRKRMEMTSDFSQYSSFTTNQKRITIEKAFHRMEVVIEEGEVEFIKKEMLDAVPKYKDLRNKIKQQVENHGMADKQFYFKQILPQKNNRIEIKNNQIRIDGSVHLIWGYQRPHFRLNFIQ